MTLLIGRNRNTNTEANVTEINISSISPTVICPVNPRRVFFRVDLESGTNQRNVYIRLYPAIQDNDKKGIVIGRRIAGNGSYFNLFWEMPRDSIYTGEISAISESSNINIYVTEY